MSKIDDVLDTLEDLDDLSAIDARADLAAIRAERDSLRGYLHDLREEQRTERARGAAAMTVRLADIDRLRRALALALNGVDDMAIRDAIDKTLREP